MPVTVICKQCGGSFCIRPSHHKRGEGQYCSRRCSGLAHRNRFPTICEYCGKEFMAKGSVLAIGKGRFCSTICRYANGHSKEHRQKIADSRTGDKHPNWKGGITPERTAYWRSDEYQNWRNSVFERDNYTCQRCLERGGYLHSHHIIPYFIAQEERFKVDNGAALCKSCHNYIHSFELVTVHNFNPA